MNPHDLTHHLTRHQFLGRSCAGIHRSSGARFAARSTFTRGRRLALMEYQRFLKGCLPGFENCVMKRMNDSVSLRGGRYLHIEPRIIEKVVSRLADSRK